MPGGNAIGVAPGTPSIKSQSKEAGVVKIVVALYPFKAIEGGDLSLEKVIFY